MADNDRQGRTTTASEMLGRTSGTTQKKGAIGGALSALSGQIGNDELLARLGQGNTSRDDLLDFLVARLAEMRTAQLAELDLANATENGLRTAMSASENQSDKPNPQRWAQAARLYQDAARALCAGQLHRGADLVDQAAKEDKTAFDSLSKFVQTEAQAAQDSPSGGEISGDTACTECAEPAGVGVADEILRVNSDGNNDLKGERRELDPWWTDLEEEEEEEESVS